MKGIMIILMCMFLMSCSSSPLKEHRQSINKISYSFKGRMEAETRSRVLVVDSGLDEVDMVKDFMCKDIASVDEHGDHYDYDDHGTNVVSIIASKMNKSKFCITMIRYIAGNPEYTDSYYKMIHILPYFSHDTAVVSMSLRHPYGSVFEFNIMKALVASNVIVNVASGNEGYNLDWGCGVFPACYGVGLPRGAFNIISNDANYSNKGKIVDFYMKDKKLGTPAMRGTSQSTALFTGLMLSK